MSLVVSSLNSGSNGNCYYVGNGKEGILVDAGISCREIEKRLKRLRLSVKTIKAIFITHEHGDHVHGVPALSRKHHIPVYITQRTQQSGNLDLKRELMIPFRSFDVVRVSDFTVKSFPILHDASDPHNFVIEYNNIRIGVFTDIGFPCSHVVSHFRECHAAFLETNYDEDMLTSGSYPLHLKERIRGGRGHLSNRQAMELFLNCRPPFMSHLFLSHLSEENNCPTIVEELFSKVADKTEVIVTSRYRETELYPIQSTGYGLTTRSRRPLHSQAQTQLSLF